MRKGFTFLTECQFFTQRQSAVRRAEQTNAHTGRSVVLLTLMVSQPIWYNGWWRITAPSCVMWPKHHRRVNKSTCPLTPLLKLVWVGGGRGGPGLVEPNTAGHFQPHFLCFALWRCHVKLFSHGATQLHIRDFPLLPFLRYNTHSAAVIRSLSFRVFIF